MNSQVCLGIGILTWERSERISDRYGSVYLIENGRNSLTSEPCRSLVNEAIAKPLAGSRGQLITKILATRESTHVGDLFRGIFPRTPEIGDEIILGDGSLFFKPAPEGGFVVGLRPEDGRTTDWLDPRALYDAHEQTVELRFEQMAQS